MEESPTTETLKDLLDDYYGESRSDDFKREIIDFIENYWPRIDPHHADPVPAPRKQRGKREEPGEEDRSFALGAISAYFGKRKLL